MVGDSTNTVSPQNVDNKFSIHSCLSLLRLQRSFSWWFGFISPSYIDLRSLYVLFSSSTLTQMQVGVCLGL